VAPDGVSTVTYGPGSFFGTSAASPHVAGAAALVKDAQPSYTPSDIQGYLEDNAVDQPPAGKDNLYGAGNLILGGPGGQPTAVALSSFTATAVSPEFLAACAAVALAVVVVGLCAARRVGRDNPSHADAL
jgi:subtilisin family serine protease